MRIPSVYRTLNAAVNHLERGRSVHLTSGPVELIVHVTDRCSFGCAMCLNANREVDWPVEAVHARSRDMRVSDLEGLLKSFPSARAICFAGVGEPLLAEDTSEMVALAHSHGLTTALISNGTELARHEDWIYSGVLDVLDLSVNAATPQELDNVCGRSADSFEKLTADVRSCCAAALRTGALRVTSSAVLWKSRRGDATRLVEHAARLGLPEIHFHNLIPSSVEGFGSAEMLDERDVEWLDALVETGRTLGVTVVPPPLRVWTHRRTCVSPWR
ncbi:radical SAM protein, partial [bacterium]|nr:radical SAM protein [bacterium]